MNARRPDTRKRMISSTVALLRERGATATTLDEVLLHSSAPRGSVYHHFPGGRAQLVEEALRATGDSVTAKIRAADDASATLAEAFDLFVQAWRTQLAESDYRAGCPVLAVAVERNDGTPELAAAAAQAFAGWQAALARTLRRHGATSAQARRRATLVVAAIEGAVALCRTERSLRPLDDVAAELRPLLGAIPGDPATSGR